MINITQNEFTLSFIQLVNMQEIPLQGNQQKKKSSKYNGKLSAESAYSLIFACKMLFLPCYLPFRGR